MKLSFISSNDLENLVKEASSLLERLIQEAESND